MTVTDTENTTAEAERQVIPAEELSDLLRLILEQVKAQHTEATGLLAKVNAASGEGVGELLSEARENSTDPEVVRLRERIAKAHEVILKATEEMDAIVRPTLQVPSEDEVEGLKSQLKELTKNIKVGSEMFDNTAKSFGTEAAISDYVKPLPGMRKSSAGKVATEGLRRPRVKTVEIRKADENEYKSVAGEDGKSTFSHLVKFFKDNASEKVETKDLHDAWFKANGTEDFDAIAEVSEFGYSVKGESYIVRITK